MTIPPHLVRVVFGEIILLTSALSQPAYDEAYQGARGLVSKVFTGE
jgi:hypothetical protein